MPKIQGQGVERNAELGYAEISTSFTKPTAGSGAEDVTGLSVTIDVGLRPVYLHFWCTHVTVDVNPTLAIVSITDSANGQQAVQGTIPVANPSTVAAGAVPFNIWCRVNPAPGTYTYKVRINVSTGGAKASIVATATARAFLRAIEA